MHWMDRVGVEITRRPRLYEPLFAGGWGNVDAVPPASATGVLETVERRSLPRSSGAVAADELRFVSPMASHLPSQSKLVNVHLTRPRGSTRLALLFAAFNDHGYATRARLAAVLAAEGVASAILEAPLYGRRRVRSGQALQSVAEFMLLGSAAVTEGIALARWLGEEQWSLVLAGYSMGGSMAAYAAALTEDLDVAVAPMAAAYSPAIVYVDAALSKAVSWNRLGPAGPDRLHGVLDSASVLDLPTLRRPSAAVLLAAEGDGYVPLEATQVLADHWAGSELRVVPGGHASLLRRRTDQASAIVDALARLSGQPKDSDRARALPT